MSRCLAHRQLEPCYYCEHGYAPFPDGNTAKWLEALQIRIAPMEKAIIQLQDAIRQMAALKPVDQTEIILDSIAPPDVKEGIAVVRDFALGDLVMLSPALKALKAKYPDRPLYFITRPDLFGVLDGADFLAGQLPKLQYEKSDFFKKFDLCRAAEVEAGGKLPLKEYLKKSRPDVFADKLGVPGGAEYFPIPVNSAALSQAQAILHGCKPPIIGLAPTCGSSVRCMPPEYAEPIAKKLLEVYGGTVVLLGKTKPYNKQLAHLSIPGVINLIDNQTVPDLIATIYLLHALISPDTGTMHVAGALGVKCLCLMGNNDPKTFSAFYPSVKTIQPKEMKCVPCLDISHPCGKLPEWQVGAECMQALNPERVMKEFQGFYNGINIAYLHDTSLDYIGGAEITTKGMIKIGREMGYNIRLFDRNTPCERFYSLYGYDLIILSNIWRFPQESMAIIMQAIRSVPYVKYEHDHDGLGQAPQGYRQEIYAKKIYPNSALNIFVSPAHLKDYADFSREHDICIPEFIDTEMFRPVKGVKRELGTTLVAVPGKWPVKLLAEYRADPKVTVLDKQIPHAEMPALYSRFEKFAHFPARRWPCDRVIFEAALCGCKVVAGDIVEAMSWEKDLGDREALRTWLDQVPQQFWNEIGKLL